MESTEREYYQALFRRDFPEARRLYRVLCCSDVWTADLIQLEGHKCGIFDEADIPDAWDVAEPNGVEMGVATDLVAAA